MGKWSPAYVAQVRSVYQDAIAAGKGPIYEVLGFEDLQLRLKALGDPRPEEPNQPAQVQIWTNVRGVGELRPVALLNRHPELIYPACGGDAKDCKCQGHEDLRVAEAEVKPQATADSWDEYKKRKAAAARKMKALAEKVSVGAIEQGAEDRLKNELAKSGASQKDLPELDQEAIALLERINAHNEGESEQYFSSAVLSENDQILARGLEAQGWLEAFHQPGVGAVQWVHTKEAMRLFEHSGVNPTDKVRRELVRLVDGITATKARTKALAKKALEKVGATKPRLSPRMVALLERVMAAEREHEVLPDGQLSDEERQAASELVKLGLLDRHQNKMTGLPSHRATRPTKLMFSFGATTPDPAAFELVDGPARYTLPCGCVHAQELLPGEKVCSSQILEPCPKCLAANAEFIRPVAPPTKEGDRLRLTCGCVSIQLPGGGWSTEATCPLHPPAPLPAGHPDAAPVPAPVTPPPVVVDSALEAAKAQARQLYETLLGPIPNLKPLEARKLALQELAQERAEENERLRARVAELEARPAAPQPRPQATIQEFAEFVRSELERLIVESRTKPPVTGIPRSSSIGKPCLRYGVLEVLGAPKAELGLESMGRFDVGDLWESEIGRRLRLLGFKLDRTQETLEFRDPDDSSVVLWRGHWDGVLTHPLFPGLAVPIDVKSMMHALWKQLWAHHAENPTEALLASKALHVRTYVDQLLSYLMPAKMPFGIFIFVSKDVGLPRVVPIVRNPERERWLIEKAREIRRVGAEARILNRPVVDLPEEILPPFTPHLEECERCDFRDVSCFPRAEVDGDHIVTGPPELLAVLAKWIPAKGIESEVKKLKELARPRFASMPVAKYHVPNVGTVNVRKNQDGTVVVDARPMKGADDAQESEGT